MGLSIYVFCFLLVGRITAAVGSLTQRDDVVDISDLPPVADIFDGKNFLGIIDDCSPRAISLELNQFILVREMTRTNTYECEQYFVPANASHFLFMHCEVLKASSDCSLEVLIIETSPDHIYYICEDLTGVPSIYVGEYINLHYGREGFHNGGYLCALTPIYGSMPYVPPPLSTTNIQVTTPTTTSTTTPSTTSTTTPTTTSTTTTPTTTSTTTTPTTTSTTTTPTTTSTTTTPTTTSTTTTPTTTSTTTTPTTTSTTTAPTTTSTTTTPTTTSTTTTPTTTSTTTAPTTTSTTTTPTTISTTTTPTTISTTTTPTTTSTTTTPTTTSTTTPTTTSTTTTPTTTSTTTPTTTSTTTTPTTTSTTTTPTTTLTTTTPTTTSTTTSPTTTSTTTPTTTSTTTTSTTTTPTTTSTTTTPTTTSTTPTSTTTSTTTTPTTTSTTTTPTTTSTTTPTTTSTTTTPTTTSTTTPTTTSTTTPTTTTTTSPTITSTSTSTSSGIPQCALECGKSKYVNSFWPHRDSKIYGGDSTLKDEFPWMVFIITTRNRGSASNNYEFCGGTLISKRDILTSAQCLKFIDYTTSVLYLGRNKLDKTLEGFQQVKTSNAAIHPDYRRVGRMYNNDIALLRLSTDVIFDDFIRPACLPPSNLGSLVNQWVTAIGWGYSFHTDRRYKNDLTKVQLKVKSNAECLMHWRNGINDQHLCTASPVTSGVCEIDNGGPLLKNINQRWNVVGVISFGLTCGARRNPNPDVYARVTEFRKWLDDNMADPCIYG